MTLSEWVNSEGGVLKCAEAHGFSSSALGSWLRGERFPTPHHQATLLSVAGHSLNLEELRVNYLERKGGKTPAKKRRLQSSLFIRDLPRLKEVFEELGLASHRCNLRGPQIIKRWVTTNVTVNEVREAVQKLEAVGRDSGDVELIHESIKEARITRLKGLTI